jgi:hypothetical protein
MENGGKLETGVGIEMEGFIVGYNGFARELIEGQPASEWTIKKVREKYPRMAEQVSMEQTSVMLEVKSNIQPGKLLLWMKFWKLEMPLIKF